jgi:hypothetical protein
LQLGGDPSKLANILGVNPDPKTGYFITKCTTNDQSGCERMIDAIINYAQTDFKNSINLKTPQSSMYTFDTQETMYRDFGVKAELPVLSPEEKEAKNYLVNQIQEDRKMYSYLEAYQKQSFYDGMVDSVTKDHLVKAYGDYNAIIREYDDYDIIYSCYGSLNNINKRCADAANNVREMHSKYNDSINFASRIANVVVINSPVGTLKFISVNVGSWCDISSSYCSGIFVPYQTSNNTFLHDGCIIDTSFGNQYFKKNFPENIGNSIACFGNINSADKFFVNRAYSDNSEGNLFGNAGHVVNGENVNYDIPANGYNVQFFYSGSKDFLYNPI